MTKAGESFPSTDLSPEAQWDAMPANAKWQIFTVIAALEVWDECGGGDDTHYMRGRTAGKYPSFKNFSDNAHPVLNLYDPFGLNKKMSQERTRLSRISLTTPTPFSTFMIPLVLTRKCLRRRRTSVLFCVQPRMTLW